MTQGQNIVPIKLRPHLVPFFYKEFEGVDGNYLGKKVKACKIDSSSSLGFMIKTCLEKCDIPIKYSKIYVWITFNDNKMDCDLYKVESGKNSFLFVPEHLNQKINDIFEDQFRMAFQFHTKGMLRANPNILVRQAIEEFMIDYEMDNYGFTLESIRRMLNRGSKHKLSRLQSQVNHLVLNCHT